jgi:hypothetical protein
MVVKIENKKSIDPVVKAIDPINITHHMSQNMGLTILTGLVMPAIPLSKGINVKAIQKSESEEKPVIKLVDNPLTRIAAASATGILMFMSYIGQFAQHGLLQNAMPNWIINNAGNFFYAGPISVVASCLLSKFKYGAEAGVLLASLYFALGETILPNIIPTGTADFKDIPMAVIGAVLPYLYFSRAYARGRRTELP